jgi:Protein of unknown function (DUF4199)
MNIKIEFRFSVLTALLTLLWLILEYVVGLQDTYIALHPYVSLIAFIIPVFTYRLALIEKLDQKSGKLTFSQAFLTGLLMTVFIAILSIPVQLAFHKLINPDFFSNMILYAVQKTKATPEQAAIFFNLKSYITESVIEYFVIGIIVSLALAYRMRTVK